MADDLAILRLEPYDDAVTVRDRLTFLTARRALLVWPPDAPILRRKLDLLLVQRQATRLGMRIALVTADWAVIEHARDLDISVFPDEQTARQAHWKRPRNRAFAPPRDPAAQAELAEHVARQRQPLSRAAYRRRQIVRWLIFAALILAVGLGFLIVAPAATVTITPANRQIFETVSIVADPDLNDVDIENYRMPAALVALQTASHVTIQTSGTETAGASQAQGLVTFTNTSDQPILIPAGTVVSTSETYPIRFETLAETTLPAGDQASVQVAIRALAEHAGTAGNVAPGAINRVEADFADRVSVINPNATYGGAIQERRFVTREDHERLLVLGRQQVLQRARDTLLHQLSGEQFLVPGSVVIVRERPEWTIFSALVGDTTESVSLDLRAEVQAVVVDERQARQVAYAGLAPYIQPGLEIAPEALSFARGDIVEIAPNGRVTFLMTVKGNIAVSIDPDRVRARLKGLSVSAAARRLEREFLLDTSRPPQIRTWPGWYDRLPVLPVRIAVEVVVP